MRHPFFPTLSLTIHEPEERRISNKLIDLSWFHNLLIRKENKTKKVNRRILQKLQKLTKSHIKRTQKFNEEFSKTHKLKRKILQNHEKINTI